MGVLEDVPKASGDELLREVGWNAASVTAPTSVRGTGATIHGFDSSIVSVDSLVVGWCDGSELGPCCRPQSKAHEK